MKLLSLGIIATLTGCVGSQPPVVPIEIVASPISRPSLVIPTIDRLVTRQVEWTIITPDNVNAVFDELQASGKPVVLYALTTNGYENLSLNTRDALKIIIQQQAVIEGYIAYYVTTDGVIVAYNESL